MVNTQMHIKNFKIYEIITIDINIKKSYDNTIVLTDQSIFSIVKSLCLIGNIFLACFWFAIITWETSYLYRQGKEVMKMCEQSKYLDQSVGSFFFTEILTWLPFSRGPRRWNRRSQRFFILKNLFYFYIIIIKHHWMHISYGDTISIYK